MGGAQNLWMEAKQESCLQYTSWNLSQESCLQYTPLESKTRILSLVRIYSIGVKKNKNLVSSTLHALESNPSFNQDQEFILSLPLSLNQALTKQNIPRISKHILYTQLGSYVRTYIGSSRYSLQFTQSQGYMHVPMYIYIVVHAYVDVACTCKLCMYGNFRWDQTQIDYTAAAGG